MQATTIAAQGEAKSDYNLAGFSVSLSALLESVPDSKAELKKKVEEFKLALDSLKTKLDVEFVKNSVRSNSNVQQQWEWVTVEGKNEKVNKGYLATYNYSFQVDDLDKVSKIYDVLTSLKEIYVSSPSYSIKDSTRERLNKKALKHAFEKVTDRLSTECTVLGLNSSDFEVYSWVTSYSDSRRSDRVGGRGAPAPALAMMASASSYSSDSIESSFGDACEDDSLELVAGQAQVSVNLEVGYARRAVQTAKVQVSQVVKGPKVDVRENDNV